MIFTPTNVLSSSAKPSHSGLLELPPEAVAPYLEPEPRSLRRNEPALLKRVIARLAALRGWSTEETVRVTTANARDLFRFPLADGALPPTGSA